MFSLEKVVYGVAKAAPLHNEGIKCCPAILCESVVPTRRTLLRFLPGGLDETVVSEPRKQRIDGAFACDQSVRRGKGSREIEAIAVRLSKQGENAVLDSPASHLSQELGGVAWYYVWHSTKRRSGVQQRMLFQETQGTGASGRSNSGQAFMAGRHVRPVGQLWGDNRPVPGL